MDGLTVASDKVSRLQMPATARSGRLVAERARLVPERWGHAVLADASKTLCGVAVTHLYRFELVPFEHLGHHLRCVSCDDLAGHPHVARRRR